MPSEPKEADVSNALPGLQELQLKTIEYQRPEDEQDKALRLHKERLSFYFKDLGALGFSALLVIVAMICCLVFLFNPKASVAEKGLAGSLFTSIVTGAIGFAFGKSMK